MKLSEKSVILSNAKETFLINWQVLGSAGLLLFALVFCYVQVFMTLVRLWWSNDIYSYGFLIPWISLYLVWVQREKLREIEPAPDYLKGGLLFLAGLSMLVVGHASSIALLEELSLIVTLMGAVLLMLGG
ncbi:MAG: archaeosortase/exosortase family protein, partial [Candidatus Manganitrophaceae bacterium]